MARIRISLPVSFGFTTQIPIRITDLNYGGHVGNDTILSLIHEARVQYLHSLGLTELQFAGVGLIMSDVAIEFKGEVFYGDVLTARVAASDFSRAGFDLIYQFTQSKDGAETPVALAKTGMVCFDYAHRKVALLPEEAKRLMEGRQS